MKIGIDARLINQTGVGRYIRNLIYNLTEIDKKNEYVLFMQNKDIHNSEFIIHNSRFKTVGVNIPWHSLKEQLEFSKMLNDQNLNLMHFPYFSVPVFYNRPFVVTIHDLIIHHFPTGKASTLPSPMYWSKIAGYKFVISKAARKAKKIIAVSNSTKEEIIDHLKVDPNKVEVTYEGIDQAFKEKRIASSLNLTKRYGLNANRYFLFVGNVYPHKNAETLINAFEKLGRKDLGLIFVGKEDYFYKRLKRHVTGNTKIQFLHDVNDQELSFLYKNAEAVVCPAFMEGFGLPALEAMANKCLVISSDTPALKEVCEDNAIYFDPRNTEELAEKMKEVLNNKKKFEGLAEKGYKRSREFSWRKMTEQTLKIYYTSV